MRASRVSAVGDERLRRVLSRLDDVWRTFDEVVPPGWPAASRGHVRGMLQRGVARGLVATRTSDAHGRVEYALTQDGEG